VSRGHFSASIYFVSHASKNQGVGMTITRFYEVTIADDTNPNLLAHVFSVPTQSLGDGYLPERPDVFLLEDLGVDDLIPIQPGNLVPALAVCFEEPQDSLRLLRPYDYFQRRMRFSESISPDYLAFAEYITLAPLVPFEQSPLTGVSLGTIFATGSIGVIGASLGLVLAGGPTPLLFITVPAGLIVCGAAMGVAEGLQQGLRRRLTRAIGGPEPPDEPE
jgi:hypothetical protein